MRLGVALGPKTRYRGQDHDLLVSHYLDRVCFTFLLRAENLEGDTPVVPPKRDQISQERRN